MNACFEMGGALVLLLNLRRLVRDKCVSGVSLLPTAFFTAWGLFNQYFYGRLHQSWSLRAGVVVCVVNLAWLALAVRYSHLQRSKKEQ
jgi:hypothetical protein